VSPNSDPIRELAGFHDEFAKPKGVYFAGNSLGVMPRGAESAVARWGNDPGTRFDMAFEMQPAGTASCFHISTPSLLSMMPLGASLEIFQRATIPKVRSASLKLTDRFMQRAKELLPEFDIVTPPPNLCLF
jgi:kynureninase